MVRGKRLYGTGSSAQSSVMAYRGGMEKGERSKGEGYTLYTQLIHLVQQKHNTGKKSYSNKELMYAMSKDVT